MKVCVLGLGYIGLPTALLLAKEHSVIGVDVNEKIVETLNKGTLPFEEPGLDDLLNDLHGKFIAKTSVEEADVFLIAVPTPLDKSMRIADLKYVRSAAEMICPVLKNENLVILESTIPPGTSENLVVPILKRNKVQNLYFVHCPERAIPGKTIYEMIHNDRIIGGIDIKSCKLAEKLYSSFVNGEMHLTDVRTAEFVKLMENTFRDVNIALANELAQIAEESQINIWNAIELANKHPRVNIHKPGPGVGGHCIAIDPWFLTEKSAKLKMISIARQINDSMPNHVLHMVRQLLQKVNEPTVTVLGLAYKADVDDMRETPALKFIKLAENEGFKIKAHDPYVKESMYNILDLEEASKDSDCLVLITDHTVFKQIDPDKMSKLMRSKNIVDTRNVLDLEKWKKAGFKIKTVGSSKI
jgi:UDP-N-acetyl-D-mannosaminuronic acid dehydrogenase